MKFPFVSRERFEEAQERIAKLEELLLGKLAEPSVVPIDPLKAIDFSKTSFTGRPTLESVRAEARKEAIRRFKTPGSKPISVELQEAALKGRMDAVGH